MGRRTVTSLALLAATLALSAACRAEEFRPFGHFLLKSHFKLTGEKRREIPIKPVVFQVATNGISVKISVEGENESTTTFQIYRSDGISRQRADRGAIEVIPGVQAVNQSAGEFRHLRLCREFLTITTFPGVSDQTVVSHAIAAEPARQDALPQGKPSTEPGSP